MITPPHPEPPTEDFVLAYLEQWLGMWPRYADVPERYRLASFTDVIDASGAWAAFCEDQGSDWTEHTRKYVYGKAWREWTAFCEANDIHPACPHPEAIKRHLTQQQNAVNSDQTLHDARFRPLFRWWEWMRYHSDYPVWYNPALFAVRRGGGARAAWATRVPDQ